MEHAAAISSFYSVTLQEIATPVSQARDDRRRAKSRLAMTEGNGIIAKAHAPAMTGSENKNMLATIFLL